MKNTMLVEMLYIFIIISVLLFLLIVDYLYEGESKTIIKEQLKPGQHIGNWRIALILIIVNLFFIASIIWGFANIEFFYMSEYYSSNGSFIPSIWSTGESNYEAYMYMFMGFAFIHCILFIQCGYYALMDAWNTRGELETKKY